MKKSLPKVSLNLRESRLHLNFLSPEKGGEPSSWEFV